MSNLQNEKNLKNKKGITLISLVVTIVVLLILAGVSIMTLTGDNGLLTRTVGAKNKTKLAEAQEIANLEYAAIEIDSRVSGTTAETTASSIATMLESKGFETDYKDAAGATLATAELYDGETEVASPIKIKKNSEGSTTNAKTLKVKTTTTGGDGARKYYVIIDGMYHEIIVGNGVTIDKEGKTEASVTNGVTDTRTVKMTISGLDSTTTIQKKVGENTYENITSETTFENNDEIRIVAGTEELTGVTIIPKVVDGSTEISVGTTVGVEITGPLAPTVAGTGEEFSTAYGTIEVVWLNKSNEIISSPLVEIPTKQVEGQTEPQNLLTPIKLNTDGTYTENPTGSWYNYAEKTGTTTSEWANAINPDDDSFFVWIPRFAYRITYYQGDWSTLETTDENYATYKTVTGYYDGYGMWNKSEKKVVRALESSDIKTVDDGEQTYIVHPAFEVSKDYGGGFSTSSSSQIAGIWVAKYEMSMENGSGQPVTTTDATIGNVPLSSTVKVVSKPGVSSWRYINIGNCYTNSYNYNRDMESHLMKNSEWGVVAYLTHSQYGRNGEEIAINNSGDYYTGYSGGSADAAQSSSTVNTYAYNTTNGVLASSTGNITGIYDLSGGAFEYVAAYNKSGNSTDVAGADYGKGMTDNAKTIDRSTYISTKYITAYDNSSVTDDNGGGIYNVGKTGDATKEVYANKVVVNSLGVKSRRNWFNDYSYFVRRDAPFFVRGGGYNNGAEAGVTYSFRVPGGAASSYTFRVVLVP